MSNPTLVTGEIIFPDSGPPAVATIYLRVEDVSLADAPSRTVAEDVRRDVQAPPPGGRLAFSLAVPAVDPRARYSVRVHVDLDGDGRVSRGDLISTQSHPVLTHGAPDHMLVPLTRVT